MKPHLFPSPGEQVQKASGWVVLSYSLPLVRSLVYVAVCFVSTTRLWSRYRKHILWTKIIFLWDVTPCTYFVICGLFSPALFNVSVYTALEDGTVLNVQLGRMWIEDVVVWFDTLSHIAWRDFQISRGKLLRQKRSEVLLIGTALSTRAPSSRGR